MPQDSISYPMHGSTLLKSSVGLTSIGFSQLSTNKSKNHLNYFIKTLNSVDSNGKKLGFISQEIGREINTIGSKANFAPMQKQVVQMKDELEKIKEQLLNVL